MNSQDLERESSPSSRRWPPALILSLGLVAGYSTAEVLDISNSLSSSSDIPTLTKADTRKFLDNVEPCKEDPLKVVFNDQEHVIIDTRCREDANTEGVSVYSSPTDSVLGPLAVIDNGTAVQALCIAEGTPVTSDDSMYESNKWVMVNLQIQEGVEFKAEANIGFVSSLDVIAESGLSQCSNDSTETV